MSMKHRAMIDAELSKAKAKHPNFCKNFNSFPRTPSAILVVQFDLENIRGKVERNGRAVDILKEEITEAVEAYLENRLPDCLVELAQCGAVVLRMMEFVQAEIDAKKGGAE